MDKNQWVLSFALLVVIVLIISIFLSYSHPDQADEDDGVFIGAIYGDVITNGLIDGHEDLFNQTVQIHYFSIEEEPLTASILNVSRITVLENDDTILDNVYLHDHHFSIELHGEGIVAFPVKEISFDYELSSFNGTFLDPYYRTDINISRVHGTGNLDMDDPTNFIIIMDGVLVFNNESISSSKCQIFFNESKDSHIEILGGGDIDLYHIPRVRINGEITLYNCVELNSKGKKIKTHDAIQFRGEENIIITVAEPDYIDHQGGYFEPWIIQIHTNT